MTWPKKHNLFGVEVTATSYDELVARCTQAARQGEPAILDFMPVHGLVTAARDAGHRAMMNAFDAVAPDGQPVRWALNLFHKTGLTDRVYGPTFTWKLCAAAAEKGIAVFFYGSTPEVLDKLRAKLTDSFPGLTIAGMVSPPFRPLTPAEDAAYVAQINDSGAGLLFLGTGCPRQEVFAHAHRGSIRAVQLCVGAAFDFHAGTKPQAPAWMQRRGLEWVLRLVSEPGRLWKRYLVTNSIFSYLFARRLLLGR